MKGLPILLIGLSTFIYSCKPIQSGMTSIENDPSTITTVGDLFMNCPVKQTDVVITHKRYYTITGFIVDPMHECYSKLIKNLLLLDFKEGTYQKDSGYTINSMDDDYTPEDSEPQVISIYTIESSKNGYQLRKHWSYKELSSLKIPTKKGSILGFFTMKLLGANPKGEADLNPFVRVK